MPRLPAKYDWSRVVYLLRERLSQSQAEFAATVGCALSTVSKWEQGATNPAPRQRRRLRKIGDEVEFPVSVWPPTNSENKSFDREHE